MGILIGHFAEIINLECGVKMKTLYKYHEYLTDRLLYNVYKLMSENEIEDMERKKSEIIPLFGVDSYKERLLIEKMFELGYIAAHCELINDK